MPAFMFEKISPPTDRGSAQPIAKNQSKKRGGLIVQILDRFVEVRSKKGLRSKRGVIARRKSKTSD
jgi:hypothetical protein